MGRTGWSVHPRTDSWGAIYLGMLDPNAGVKLSVAHLHAMIPVGGHSVLAREGLGSLFQYEIP